MLSELEISLYFWIKLNLKTMKKIYLIAAALFLGAGAMAQTGVRTLTSHFEGALTDPTNPQVAYYANTNGYLSGNNGDGDLGCVQLFDAQAGVSTVAGGTIEGVKIMVPHVTNTTGTGKVKVGVWAYNNGNVGALLASQDVNLSDINTTQAGTQLITAGTTVKGLYNVSVDFTNISIPTNKKFYAGILYPTTATDSIAVLTTKIGYDYALAATHAGIIDVDGDFLAYNDPSWMAGKFSNAIFPVLNQSTLSLTDLQKDNKLVVYPNPANDFLNFRIEGTEISAVNVFSTDGKLVSANQMNNVTSGTINVSNLNTGMYIYEVVATNGATSKSTFVKK